MDNWSSLSIKDKSDIMRVAIENGITDLGAIKAKYNEFADGGNLNSLPKGWTLADENNYNEWRNNLPDNLKNTEDNYDMRRAFKAGMQPVLESDGKYHLGSRDPKTGRILKSPYHPTFLMATATDARMGYYPKTNSNGVTFTSTWKGNQFKEGGHVYDELPQLLKDAGLDIRVTSGFRGPRYEGDKSWHIHHGAVDIVPQGKTTFEDIEKAVYGNPAIYNYMLDNGLGLLDETGRTQASRDTMKKTRATGAHFHFGKDKVPAKRFADRMSSLWDNKMESINQGIATPALPMTATSTFTSTPLPMFNPYSTSYQPPIVQEPEQPLVQAASEYSQEALDRQDRQERLQRFGLLMSMLNPQESNPFTSTISMLSGNMFEGGGNKSSFVRSLETQPTILEQVAKYNKEPKARRVTKESYRQQRIREQKAANQRERNIAKQYLAAGPNIGNLVKAAYHWYNSVPILGGQPEDGNDYITGVVDVPGMRNPKDILKGVSAVDKAVSKITRFYHGSPVKFDVFDTQYIGSGEGGSKVMKGVNLWPEEKIANAPKLANIKSPDAPIHLGVSSTPLGGKLNPTVYDVSGKDLKLYKATPREIKSLKQEDLVKQGYDGVQTPNQVTIFPESIGKLSIDKQSSIEDFVMSHPEVERWTPWTTDAQKMQNIVDASKMRTWTPVQWTAAQDAAIARGDMVEAQRLRDLHFRTYQNGDMVDVNGNPIHVYHGSPEENITEFYKPNDPRLPAPKGINFKATGEEGIYTSPRKGYAARYMQDLGGRYHVRLTKEQKALLKAGKTREEIGLPPIPEGRIYDLYSNTSRVPKDLDISFNPFTLSTEEANIIKSKGYSGFDIPSRKYPEHVVLEPNQLKLADAVTFDDKGVRIPLGERDNFNINDIRYAIAPILAGGVGYGAYRNQKALGGNYKIK